MYVDKSCMCSGHGESLPTIPRIGWQVAVVFPCSYSTLAITRSFDKLRLMGVMNWKDFRAGLKGFRDFFWKNQIDEAFVCFLQWTLRSWFPSASTWIAFGLRQIQPQKHNQDLVLLILRHRCHPHGPHRKCTAQPAQPLSHLKKRVADSQKLSE